MDEINKELDEILKQALPDVPEHEIPAGEKVKEPVKTRKLSLIFTTISDLNGQKAYKKDSFLNNFQEFYLFEMIFLVLKIRVNPILISIKVRILKKT